MTAIDWSRTTHFKPSEWPAGTLERMEPELLHAVFELRKRCGASMIPSPLYDAHVRTTGTSRHSTQGGKRLSDATDIFVTSWPGVWKAWNEALKLPFGGIGLYADTQLGKPMPMLHLDMRPERVMWVRHSKTEYVYFNNNPMAFFAAINKYCRGA